MGWIDWNFFTQADRLHHQVRHACQEHEAPNRLCTSLSQGYVVFSSTTFICMALQAQAGTEVSHHVVSMRPKQHMIGISDGVRIEVKVDRSACQK